MTSIHPIRRSLVYFIFLLAATNVLFISAEVATADSAGDRYPVMHMTGAERAAGAEGRLLQKRAARAVRALPAGSVDLLPLVPYIPAERNQMRCGDCWVWAATGGIEVALYAELGISERLSIQHFQSNYNDGGMTGRFACDGGWSYMYTDFYNTDGTKRFIPWSNTNAAWADGNGGTSGGYGGGKRTNMPAELIAETPAFPVSSVSTLTVDTYGVGEEQAIDNIKAILQQNRALQFSFFLPDDASWTDFYNFWDQQDETALFDFDPYDMLAWNDSQGGGHAVLLVGYNDTDPNPDNHYWELLNSWGVIPTRPRGTFRVKMHINYDNKDGTYLEQNLAVDQVTPVFDLDSDDDGVADAMEVMEGSDPNDKGSVIPALPTSLCSEWNGFLSPMWNIMEHDNSSAESLSVTSTLYDRSGAASNSVQFSVPANGQWDLLVHGMTGRTADSYGKICSDYSGTSGSIDGRMVYYRPKADDSDSFEFAFAMPFSAGLTGVQYVSYNTYQPSLDPADAANSVTNWVQLTNLDDESQYGTLTFYNQIGEVAGIQSLQLAAGERLDFSAHQFGSNLVGLVKWEPSNSDAAFQLRNVHYYYDSTGESFVTAYQTAGVHGSGRPLTAPVNTIGETSVIELANGSAATITAAVTIYNSRGETALSTTYTLAPYATYHVVADQYLSSDVGVATVTSNAPETLLVTVVQYKRTASGGVTFIYPIPATEALGTELRGAYNTFLGQQNWLIIANASESEQDVLLGLASNSGTLLAQQSISVPAHQPRYIPLSSYVLSGNYGLLQLRVNSNSIVASVLRVGADDSYCMSTPVRP